MRTLTDVNYQALVGELRAAILQHSVGDLFRALQPMLVSRYVELRELPTAVTPPRTGGFIEVFGSLRKFLTALRMGRPDAFELGLEVLAELDSDAAGPIALHALQAQVWPQAMERAVYALSKVNSAEAFDAILHHLDHTRRGAIVLGQSPFPDGGPAALAFLEQHPSIVFEAVLIPDRGGDLKAMSGRSVHPANQIRVAAALVAFIGERGYAAGVPIVRRIYAGHPATKLRSVAGWALDRLGDWTELLSYRNSADERRRFFATLGAMRKRPAGAVAALNIKALRADPDLAGLAFEALNHDLAWQRHPVDSLLMADARWADVLGYWLDGSAEIAVLARGLLRHVPIEQTAHDSDHASAPAQPIVARYRDDDSRDAWIALNAKTRSPNSLSEAAAITSIMMTRVRHNLELAVERLEASGYHFSFPNASLCGPSDDAAAALAEIESLVGPLPLAVQAFYRCVGSCDFRGTHPDWTRSADVSIRGTDRANAWLTDPLVITPLEEILEDAQDHDGPHQSFIVTLSGDPYAKAGLKGGVYSFRSAEHPIDVQLLGVQPATTFVEHLRLALSYAVFPGFATATDRPTEWLAQLTANFLLF